MPVQAQLLEVLELGERREVSERRAADVERRDALGHRKQRRDVGHLGRAHEHLLELRGLASGAMSVIGTCSKSIERRLCISATGDTSVSSSLRASSSEELG